MVGSHGLPVVRAFLLGSGHRGRAYLRKLASGLAVCPNLLQPLGFTLCHVDVSGGVDLAHVFAALVHHLVEDLRLHLHLFLILNFRCVHPELERLVLSVERVHRSVFDAARSAAERAPDGVAQEPAADSFEDG